MQIWLGWEKYLAKKLSLNSDISIFWEEFFVLPFSTSSTIQIVPISNTEAQKDKMHKIFNFPAMNSNDFSRPNQILT